MIDPDAWYTTPQVAKFLGCREWSIRERLKKDIIAGRQLPSIGGGSPRWRVQGDEVLRLLGAAFLARQPKVKAGQFERMRRETLKELGLDGSDTPAKTGKRTGPRGRKG